MGLFIAMLLLVGTPACISLKKVLQSEEDPQIAALQKELDEIANLNSAMQSRIESIHNLVFSLEAQVDHLEASLDRLAGRPVPKSRASVHSSEPPMPKRKLGPPETRVELKPVSRKWAPETKAKKAIISAKLSPGRQYEKAYGAYAKHHFDEAMALFKKFLQRYSKHDLADNAQYWIGEIYYDMEDYPNAILAFKRVVTNYGERSKAPDALLKIGYSYLALDDLVNARIYFKRVIKDYPFSETEAKARAKLKELGVLHGPET